MTTKSNDLDVPVRGAREICRVANEEGLPFSYSQVQYALATGKLPAELWGHVYVSTRRRIRGLSARFRGE